MIANVKGHTHQASSLGGPSSWDDARSQPGKDKANKGKRGGGRRRRLRRAMGWIDNRKVGTIDHVQQVFDDKISYSE